MKHRFKEDNEIISEFMGFKNVGTSTNPMYDWIGGGVRDLHGLRYAESWDWLMPVLKKINEQHVSPNVRGLWRTITNPYEFSVEEVYLQAVEVIKQLNNNNE